jgi:hypothetical protein
MLFIYKYDTNGKVKTLVHRFIILHLNTGIERWYDRLQALAACAIVDAAQRSSGM